KGITEEKEQKAILMAIKEERISHYLTSLLVLCDWTSMAAAAKELLVELMKVKGRRNTAMHGSVRNARDQVVKDLNTLLSTIEWLAKNPFGYFIPSVPELYIASADFYIDDAPKSTPSDEPPMPTSDPGNPANMPC